MSVKRSLASAVVGLFLMTLLFPMASAVNSLCATGPGDENSHNNNRNGIESANDELNDYYNNNGQEHQLFSNGLRVSNLLMRFQRIQPQHLVIAAHGGDGDVVYMGTTNDHETLEADDFTEFISTGDGDNTGWKHAAAPFSSIVLGACDSSQSAVGVDFNDALMGTDGLGAWIFIGHPKAVLTGNVRQFIAEYSDEVTDQRSAYDRAWEEGVKATSYYPWNRYASTLVWRKDCADKDHCTRHDRYRNIVRNEGSEGSSLGMGSSTAFDFTRSFSGTSNGGYIVFHGIINNDEDDINNAAKVTIKVYKWSNNAWVEESGYASTWDPIYNQACNRYGNTQYGGTDICSVYIKPSFLTGTIGNGKIKFEVTNVNDGHSDSIMIDRFEFMEIGR